MNRILYKADDLFKILSTSSSDDVITELPAYSITFYDDVELKYPRQSQDGVQLFSNIISDDFYPNDTDATDLENYQSGISEESRRYYCKIIVEKNITQDVAVGQESNVFTLNITKLFPTKTIDTYNITLLEKNERYTIYTTTFAIEKSDFVKDFDGNIFFSLDGKYSVRYAVPINIRINNSATSSLNQTTTDEVKKKIDSKSMLAQYYRNLTVAFSGFHYSDSFDFDFSDLSLVLSSNLFDTNSIIYETNTNEGVFFKFDLINGYSTNVLNHFALTLKNTDALYNPNTDTLFTLRLYLGSGETINVNTCEVFANTEEDYYNIVFKFQNLADFGYINYITIEIKTLNLSISGTYQITYMNFVAINRSTVFGAASFKSLANNFYTTSTPSGKELTVSSLRNNELVQNIGGFSLVQNIIEFTSDINYSIETEENKILLPEFAQILTINGFKQVDEVSTGDKIFHTNEYVNIKSIKTSTSESYELFETYDGDSFYLNGFVIKMPKVYQKFSRKILNKTTLIETSSFIKVNGLKCYLMTDGVNKFSNKKIALEANNTHEISSNEKIRLVVQSDKKISTKKINFIGKINNESLLELDQNIICTIKVTEDSVIKKVLVIDED